MTTTKLDLVNRVLDSVGERRVAVTTGALALIAEDCIQLALDEVATQQTGKTYYRLPWQALGVMKWQP
jgi:hypothetical protein